MAAGQFGKALKVAAVARMRHHQRAVERGVWKMLAPEIERADAEPADDGLRHLCLAPRRQHAAGPMAGGKRHPGVTALMQGHGVASLRKKQRLPRASNARAYDGDGGIPPDVRTLVHPCTYAGMTRIRFKGSSRSSLEVPSLPHHSTSSEPPS